MGDTAKSSEGHQLDSISGEEAKAILHQLGYFADDIHFLSMRLSDVEFQQIQEAYSHHEKLSIESFISALCEQDILDREEQGERP